MTQKNVEDFYPLSPMQQGMLFHSLYAPESGVYVGQMSATLRGRLDVAAFQRAWARLVERHAVLRTGFVVGDLKEPVQVVQRQVTLPWTELDWRAAAPDEQAAQLQDFLRADQRRGFTLHQAPLLRLALIQLADDRHRFVWTYHHLLFDGWSLPLLLREVFALYQAFQAGQDLALPPAPPFRNYIAWLRKRDLAKAEAHWRGLLQDFTAPTPLVIDHGPAPAEDGAGGVVERMTLLPRAVTDALKTLARQRALTLNTLVQGAWALLLHRYSGEADVVFGATVSGRPAELPGAEHMVGLFINTLPVRARLDPDQPAAAWLKALQSQQLDTRQYEFSPLVQVQGWSAVPRGQPLFESILVFENFPVGAAVREAASPGAGAALTLDDVQDVQQTNFPLTLVAYPGDELALRLAYDTARFDAAAVERMLGHLATLLTGLAAAPDQALGSLALLTEAERQQVLLTWNATQRPTTPGLVHQRFEAQAARNPAAPALRFEAETVTYAELNARADRLAHALRQRGIGPDQIVGVCCEPSPDMIVAVLATLKAGGAFLPLDPYYPADRLAFMLQDSGAPLVLTTTALVARLAGTPAQTLRLDADWETRAPSASDALPPAPDSLAYVIYTSGSTGRPKGTLLEHRGLANLADVLIEKFAITPASRVLQFASFSFDAAVSEIVMALAAGATLVLARREVLTSPPDLLRLLRAEAVTTVTLPPSLLAVLPPDELPALTTVVSAGEACGWDIAAAWASGRRFLNGYGPTETTVAAAYYQVTERVPHTASVPIGGPNANVQVYVLDARQRPVPVGVPGELYIGGLGVARGYLNRPELTAEKFVTLTLSDGHETKGGSADVRPSASGLRLYRTGDRVRWLPSGDLEFLGRLDYQVKLRGFRIELGEVEAALRQHPAVQDAAALVREDAPGDKRLVAYFVPDPQAPAPDPAALRESLKGRLPDYMLPAAFVALERFPLTPNGKVDRAALPAPEAGHLAAAAAYVAPRTPAEEIIASVWAAVLGLPRVGVFDQFFELGGHSLLATQVISRLRDALGVEVPLRHLFEAPVLAEFAARAETAQRAATGTLPPPLEPTAEAGERPLSFAQQRLWYLDQLEPGSPLYNIPTAVRLRGPLDADALARALNAVVARHASLRTTFAMTADGRAHQVIAPALTLTLGREDLTALPEAEREAAARRRARAEAQRPFDLAAGPLLRASLLHLGADDHALLLTLHHIVADGWSMTVLVRELLAFYQAGEQAPLPALPLQYADFAGWQRRWLQGEALDAQLAYWRRQLAGAPPLLELPTDRPRPAVQSFRGATYSFSLPRELADRLRALSQKAGATLFMTLLAGFQALLARYSNQDDLAVGTPIANRNRAETEGLIGFFVNTLVLRADLSDDPSFRDLLKRVREAALGAYAHQDVPFEMVVDALQPERNLSYPPLFQVLFALQNTGRLDALSAAPQTAGALTITSLDAHSGTAKFDLTLEMMEGPDGLGGAFEYNTDLFDAATIERLAVHFHNLLAGAAASPETPVSRLPLLTDAERRQLLVDWNPPADFDADGTLSERFAAQAARTPDAVAVSFDDGGGRQTLTYAELDRRANQLAQALRARGVGPDVLVALCLERSLDMVVAILGTLKAGGAYLPLDLAYPSDRLAFMIEDARAPVLISQAPLADRLPATTAEVLWIDRDWDQIARLPDTAPESGAAPEHLAYVIFTSGSTGRPKGVMVTHANVIRLFTATEAWYHFGPEDVWTLFHSYAFDFSVWELWGALLYGGRLVVVPYLTSRSPEAFYDLLHTEAVTVLNQTPSAFKQLIRVEDTRAAAAGLALRAVIFGGEALEFGSLRPWFDRHGDQRPQLVNMYGITETTVHVTYRPVSLADLVEAAPSMVGRPIPDLQVYVLDRHRQPAPIGVVGELYVGGAGVARGYLNRPELTAERFVEMRDWRLTDTQLSSANPQSFRLYKTGDLARFRPNGDLEYLGRIDHQVKIRGFRIELGEIEALLGAQPGVRETLVLAREDQPGDKRLVAYLVPSPDTTLTVGDLRAALKAKLPEYMVPAAFVVLPAFPLTPNGKIDRKALPAPDTARRDLGTDYLAPRTPAEAALARVWAQLLRVERVGVRDNFFELGGDSILSIQVIAQAAQAGLRLTPRMFFQNPTIEGLAALAQSEPAPTSEQGVISGAYPLTPIQRWFFAHHPRAPHHWNTSLLMEVWAPLDVAQLERAVQELLAHHDALRSRFTPGPDGWQARITAPDEAVPFSHFDLSGTPPEAQAAVIEAEAARLQASLDLEHGPLVRVAVFTRGPGQSARLLLVFHHLVFDGVSLRLVIEDLQRLYAHSGDGPALPPKTTPYTEWATRLSAHAQAVETLDELDFWRRQTGADLPALPVDFADGPNTYGGTERVVVSLDVAATHALLRDLPAATGAQIQDALLAALVEALAGWTGRRALVVELEGHGREDLFTGVDVSRTVGWFTSMFPVRLDLEAAPDPAAAVRAVQAQLRAVPRRGVGYGLLRYLANAPELRAAPAPDVNFNYLGQFDAMPVTALPFSIAPESSGPEQFPDGRRSAQLYVVGTVSAGTLDVLFSYSPGRHQRATIERLAEAFVDALRRLLAASLAGVAAPGNR